MKTKILVSILVLAIPVLSRGQASWTDDFESYGPGTWPYKWKAEGSAASMLVNSIDTSVSFSGSASLRLSGMTGENWPAAATRTLKVSPPFDIEMAVMNGVEKGTADPERKRITLALRQSDNATEGRRPLLSFSGNGEAAEEFAGVRLGPFTPGEWYMVRIRYEKTPAAGVKIRYWVDGIFRDSLSLPAVEGSNKFSVLEVRAEQGTVWIDDVSIIPVLPGTGDPYKPAFDPEDFGDGPVTLSSFTAGSEIMILKVYDRDGNLVYKGPPDGFSPAGMGVYLPQGAFIYVMCDENGKVLNTQNINFPPTPLKPGNK